MKHPRTSLSLLALALATLGLCGAAEARITVTKARIGCLDIQTSANLTHVVGAACNGKTACAYKAPTESQYRRAGVYARTRTFCTQAMEIVYGCGNNVFHTVVVPGDAWNHPPASLACSAPRPASPAAPAGRKPDTIRVTNARIGCLDIQKSGNLTSLVGRSCNGMKTCAYKAPTQGQYRAAGVQASTRMFCTQAMEITYDCGRNDPRSVTVPGDAWNHPAASLACEGAPLPANVKLGPGEAPIRIMKARIGCLDIQHDGNLTRLVAPVCNNRSSCSYKAPTEHAYRAAGVRANTRFMCSQGMEITYRCGDSDDQVVAVRGDAWNHPPAQIACNGKTVASNRLYVTPPPAGTAQEPLCQAPKFSAPDYIMPPRDMLDWYAVTAGDVAKVIAERLSKFDLFETLSGFIPNRRPTRAEYNSSMNSSYRGAPGSTLGTFEGRLRPELRAVAQKRDALHALCQAAQRHTRNRPATADTPSDRDLAKAFADLAVTGRAAFATFVARKPNETTLRAHPACRGASAASLTTALDRAYAVAQALRVPHASKQRQDLKWIAVSGEDDQPHRPVNVPSTKFQQFGLRVNVPKFNIPIQTRFMIAHRERHTFAANPPLINGPANRRLPDDPKVSLAKNAQVILFIHGMDSRVEEAEQLTDALHKIQSNKNWTMISLDLPTSGYADNIDHNRVGPVGQVACHHTRLLDFIEDFIVAFVDTLDARMGGQLKPKIQAIVGGSLGGNMSMRLGRRANTPWVRNVVPWSPAAIWPSMIAQPNAIAAGCDTGWDMLKDRGVNTSLNWSGKDPSFLPRGEQPWMRIASFYGGFDWPPVFGLGGPPQAECWLSNRYKCKKPAVLAARIDRQETYDSNFRAWHWRLGAEQLAFSQQQFAPGTKTPLYLRNNKRMMLLCGIEDTCADLCKHTIDVAGKMTNTPGYARFMKLTGHSLDNEYPYYIAREIATFLK